MISTVVLAFAFALPVLSQLFTPMRSANKLFSGKVSPISVALDEERGFVYLGGYSVGLFEERGYEGEYVDNSNYAVNNGKDAFISKHFLNGTAAWVKVIGQEGDQIGQDIVQDTVSGDVFMEGSTTAAIEGSAYLLNGDSFIARFSANGSRVFLRVFGTSGYDYMYELKADSAKQQLVVAGKYSDNIAILLCFMSNGSIANSNVFQTGGAAFGSAAASTPNDYFIGGEAYGAIDSEMNHGYVDVFLSKTNMNGTRYWSMVWGNSSGDCGYDLAYDAKAGLLFVGGHSTGANFNGMNALGAEGDYDITIFCAFENGTLYWSRVFGGSAGDFGAGFLMHPPSGTLFIFGYSGSALPGMETPGSAWMFQLDKNGTHLSDLFLNGSDVFGTVFDSSYSTIYCADSFGYWVTFNAIAQDLSPSSGNPVYSVESSTNVAAPTTVNSQVFPTTSVAIPYATPASSVANGIPTMILAAIAAAAFILPICLLLFCLRCRKRPSPKSGVTFTTDSLSTLIVDTLDEPPMSVTQGQAFTQGQTNMNTLLRSNFELSLPGYLEFKNGATFRIMAQIALGGGGSVCMGDALDPKLKSFGPKMIVKVVGDGSGSLLSNLSVRQTAAFYQEVSIMHFFREEKHIAKLLGWAEAPACLLMKFYRFGSLDKWVRKGAHVQMTKFLILHFLQDISRGVMAMHTVGFVHCDLKPQNVLIDVDENDRFYCVLTDFGITQIVDDSSLLVKDFAVVNLNGLSIQYAAPEAFKRYRSKSGSEKVPGALIMKADLYSLAVIMLELLKRTTPWPK